LKTWKIKKPSENSFEILEAKAGKIEILKVEN
jgi:hypothetical protein